MGRAGCKVGVVAVIRVGLIRGIEPGMRVMRIGRPFVTDGATGSNLNAVRTHPTLRARTVAPTCPTLRVGATGTLGT